MPESERPRKRYKPRLYHITFPAAHRFADLEAKVKGASVDTLLRLMEVADAAEDVAQAASPVLTDAHRQAVETMIREFAPLLTWWNVDDENGDPVAPDEAGVRRQDFAMVMALFAAWQESFASVAPPLPPGSAVTRDPVEEQIPMSPFPES